MYIWVKKTYSCNSVDYDTVIYAVLDHVDADAFVLSHFSLFIQLVYSFLRGHFLIGSQNGHYQVQDKIA